jgi:hypothetical protein
MEKINLCGKDCYIVAEHHQVLFAWQKFFDENNITPAVVTLDHHTDTLPSFSKIRAEISDFSFPSNLKIDEAINLLQHDEHIDYALRKNLIKQSIIVAHTQSSKIAHEKITLLSDGFLTDDIPLNSPALRGYFDHALEDDFLTQFQQYFPPEPYILDIDLDYFKTKQSLEPENYSIFKKLAKNAEIITLSREEIWVKLLTFEDNTFNSDYIIEKLSLLLN